MDLNHYYGGDLAASPSGDLALAPQELMGTQRVYRRLLTNAAQRDSSGNVVVSGDYLAQQDYGAGVGKMIGSPQGVDAAAAVIKGQMLMEDAVTHDPAPVISLTSDQGFLSASIQYTDANTAAAQFVNFDITTPNNG